VSDDEVAHVAASGDDALVLTLAGTPSLAATERVVSAWRALLEQDPPWLIQAQPSYTQLQVVFSPDGDVDTIAATLLALPRAGGLAAARTISLEVDYDGADLDDVARHAGLTVEGVIALHADRPYRCAFTGFLPGFPYLLGLDERLHTPRLAKPRAEVPAGSVGIGGTQTGVYPLPSPGGWRLIGRVRAPVAPDLIRAGDVVIFRRAR
jgi:KipI family sensor histidine kinase inhibitor